MGPLSALFAYWRGLAICAAGGKYSRLCSALPHLTPQERLCIYSLALHLRLFGDGHYRSGTFQNDLAKNLRNVALPATGVPLSVFCSCRPLALLFAWLLLPLAALVAAVRRPSSGGGSLGGAFASSLLSDWSWFHYWRLNCVLASYHALATSDPGYGLEDKQLFLAACERQGVAASPSLSDRAIVVKHRNEEGGLGLHTFRNAAHGGDWILQPALSNAPSIAKLLPPVAPLSTLRLVTASRASLHQRPAPASLHQRPAEASSLDEGGVEVLSACFRAGRAGASTDHSCVMFDVDVATGDIRRGTTSAHWYQLGLARARRCPLFSEGHTVEVHPDCGAPVCGEVIPDMASIASLVREAHRKLMPGVPLVGWDVAITAEAGVCLLEANLSCNFFRASFDERVYFAFAEALLGRLEGKAGRC